METTKNVAIANPINRKQPTIPAAWRNVVGNPILTSNKRTREPTATQINCEKTKAIPRLTEVEISHAWQVNSRKMVSTVTVKQMKKALPYFGSGTPLF